MKTSPSIAAVATDDLRIRVILEGEWTHTTLGEFLRDNAEGLGARECADIEAAVRAGRVYTGGGGAAPRFTVHLAT